MIFFDRASDRWISRGREPILIFYSYHSVSLFISTDDIMHVIFSWRIAPRELISASGRVYYDRRKGVGKKPRSEGCTQIGHTRRICGNELWSRARGRVIARPHANDINLARALTFVNTFRSVMRAAGGSARRSSVRPRTLRSGLLAEGGGEKLLGRVSKTFLGQTVIAGY